MTRSQESISKNSMHFTVSPSRSANASDTYFVIVVSEDLLNSFVIPSQPYTVDVGYERFLGPEVFFNPEIYSSDFLTPLPEVVDNVIQSAPIDVRRGLYKVSIHLAPLLSLIFDLGGTVLTGLLQPEHCIVRRIDHVRAFR